MSLLFGGENVEDLETQSTFRFDKIMNLHHMSIASICGPDVNSMSLLVPVYQSRECHPYCCSNIPYLIPTRILSSHQQSGMINMYKSDHMKT